LCGIPSPRELIISIFFQNLIVV
jgi:hypothetical protein